MNLEPIRALALDVDGVLTDGGFWWGPNGEEWKRFCFADVMGVSRAIKAGIVIALVSGESSPLIDRFAEKMGIRDIEKGCKDKVTAVVGFAKRRGFEMKQICFMGDDVNDVDAMRACAFGAAPANAQPAVKDVAAFVSSRNGGDGAVRELIEAILSAQTAQAALRSA